MSQFKKHCFLIFMISILFFSNNAIFAGYIGNLLPEKDAAAFSLLVYRDQINPPPIPDGFILLCQCPLEFQNKDYYGEAYYRLEYDTNSDGHKTDKPIGVTVVIAHRGTVLKTDNLIDDLQVTLKMAPNSFFTSSKPFTDYVRTLAYSKFPYSEGFATHTFIHTGHSLGAIHAELNYVYQTKNDYGNVYAITFESPGSKEIIVGLILTNILSSGTLLWWTGSSVEIINADINCINTLNHQISRVWRINHGYDFVNVPKMNVSPVDIKYFMTLFTYDQHSMEKIYDYFKNGGQLFIHRDYPVGIENAFKYYKTYYPESNKEHRDYWDQAFKLYWDNHNEIHAAYGNSLDNYREYMIRHHLS
jgi:hypothetical protein